jgi:hypothetical protein
MAEQLGVQNGRQLAAHCGRLRDPPSGQRSAVPESNDQSEHFMHFSAAPSRRAIVDWLRREDDPTVVGVRPARGHAPIGRTRARCSANAEK